MIERTAIAERSEREESALHFGRLACFGNQQQRLKRFGPAARGETERGGQDELASTTTQRGLEHDERRALHELGAKRERLRGGDTHERIAIRDQACEEVLDGAIIDIA